VVEELRLGKRKGGPKRTGCRQPDEVKMAKKFILIRKTREDMEQKSYE